MEARPAFHAIFLAFAPYSTYDVPEEPWQVPLEAEFPKMADDIWNLALPLDDMPDWQNKSKGNPTVPFLNAIKTKHPNLTRWVANVFQHIMFAGTSTPGRGAQKRQKEKAAKGKGKGKDKGHDKGKGKGNDKGQCKDKGKGKDKGKVKREGKGKATTTFQ